MTQLPIRAALILPDLGVRRDFTELMNAELPGIALHVRSPLKPGETPAELADVEVLFTFGQFLNDEVLAHAKKLRWIQALGSGLDGITDRPTLHPDVIVTNARGIHHVCVPEAAFALMMALARHIPQIVRAQAEHRWAQGPSHLLSGRTVGVLGVGMIAEGLAQRCAAFGMRVEGISGRASAPGFDCLHPYEKLREVVGRFDYFVLVAPLTSATRDIVNRDVLAAMKPGAFLVNVARGGVLNEEALLEALRRGQLAGAALDVFTLEPLPPDSPLWDAPNLLISPHGAGSHHDYARHAMPIVTHNFEAYRQGRTADLMNLVNRAQPMRHST